jgi:hypothetical protein
MIDSRNACLAHNRTDIYTTSTFDTRIREITVGRPTIDIYNTPGIEHPRGRICQPQKCVIYLRQQLNSIVYHTIVQNAKRKGNVKKTGHALVLVVDLVVLSVAPVADDVHPADHLTHGEETDNLREGNTSQGEFRLVGIADTSNDV